MCQSPAWLSNLSCRECAVLLFFLRHILFFFFCICKHLKRSRHAGNIFKYPRLIIAPTSPTNTLHIITDLPYRLLLCILICVLLSQSLRQHCQLPLLQSLLLVCPRWCSTWNTKQHSSKNNFSESNDAPHPYLSHRRALYKHLCFWYAAHCRLMQ